MALSGHVDHISRSAVEGWAADASHPSEPVSVSIYVDGVHRGTRQAVLPRPGIEAANGPMRCGFRFVFEPPLPLFAEQRVEVRETWSADLLPNGERTLPSPRRSIAGDGREPILVTSTGRSGTTLLISAFSRCRDIVVGGEYPFEIKQIAYHAAAFRALTAEADRERSTNPDTMLADDMSRTIGSNPYNLVGLYESGDPAGKMRDFFERDVPERYAAFFQSEIGAFYDRIAAMQEKPSARYFCEKGGGDEFAGEAARLFFGQIKEIVVVRDPRDLICSSMAFWNLTPADAMRTLRNSLPRLAKIAHEVRPDRIVIRYEDLVRDPTGSWSALSRFLGLDPANDTALIGEPLPGTHRTSENAAASIDRWWWDLPKDLLGDCEAEFASFMGDFDYTLSDGRAHGARAGTTGHAPSGRLVVAAEGGPECVAFLEKTEVEDADGILSREVFSLTFAREGDGLVRRTEGWSAQEEDYVWTDAEESHLWLPPIRTDGEYRLHIAGAPFTHEDKLPCQLVTVLIDGTEVGRADLRAESVMVAHVPAAAVAAGRKIRISLCVATAARPKDILGGDDDRLLGFALRRIALFRVDPRWVVLETVDPDTIHHADEIVDPPVWAAPNAVPAWRTVPPR